MSKPHYITIELPNNRRFQIHDLPKGRTIKILRAVRIDDVSLLMAANGVIYSAGKRNSTILAKALMDGFTHRHLEAIRRFGLISKREVELIKADFAEGVKNRAWLEHKEDLVRACKGLGIKPPRVPRRR